MSHIFTPAFTPHWALSCTSCSLLVPGLTDASQADREGPSTQRRTAVDRAELDDWYVSPFGQEEDYCPRCKAGRVLPRLPVTKLYGDGGEVLVYKGARR